LLRLALYLAQYLEHRIGVGVFTVLIVNTPYRYSRRTPAGALVNAIPFYLIAVDRYSSSPTPYEFRVETLHESPAELLAFVRLKHYDEVRCSYVRGHQLVYLRLKSDTFYQLRQFARNLIRSNR
jgi:hypothetical protein